MSLIRINGKLLGYADWDESKPLVRELMKKEWLNEQHTSEKAHELASILISVETVVEYDMLVTEFNLMQPTLRDHVQRVEDINNGTDDLNHFLESMTGDKVL